MSGEIVFFLLDEPIAWNMTTLIMQRGINLDIFILFLSLLIHGFHEYGARDEQNTAANLKTKLQITYYESLSYFVIRGCARQFVA